MLQTNQKCYKKKNEKCYKNLAMNYSKIVHSYQIPYESLEECNMQSIIKRSHHIYWLRMEEKFQEKSLIFS